MPPWQATKSAVWERRMPSNGSVREIGVPSGFTNTERISLDGDGSFALLRYRDGTIRLRHKCVTQNRGVRITAPALHRLHRVTVENGRTTVHDHSISCSDCSLHGWIRDGRWEPA